MIKDAEKYADEDAKRRKEAEDLNAADALCYQAEKLLADYSDKLVPDMRNKLTEAMQKTRAALQNKNANQATEASKELEKVLREAGAALYSQSSAAPQTGPYAPHPYPETGGAGAIQNRSGSGERGRVVDADYVETR